MADYRSAPMIYKRPRNTYPMLDASGAAAGRAQDASVGMPHMKTASNEPYAFNATQGEWQYCHTIKSGDTLWKLSGLYYGTSSLDGVHAIYNVPQNKAIQGPSADSGLIPGDVILIPGLPQPAVAPVAADSIPSSPPQGMPGGYPIPTTAGSPLPGPVPASAPQGWPTNVSYPPLPVPSGSDIDVAGSGPIVLPETDITGDPNDPDLVTVSDGSQAPFWTNGRIALAAGAGVLGIGTIVWLATRKKRRRAA